MLYDGRSARGAGAVALERGNFDRAHDDLAVQKIITEMSST